MIQIALEAISAALGLWKSKESRKYADRILELRMDYNEEMDKDESIRDNGRIDFIDRELRIVWEAISVAIKSEKP